MNTGYAEAINRLLPNILTYMIQQNIINNDIAQRMFASKDQWAPQFVQSIGGQPMQESVFQNAMLQFLANARNTFMNMNPVGFNPNPGMGMGMMPQPSRFGMTPGYINPGFNVAPYNQPPAVPTFGRTTFGGFDQPVTGPNAAPPNFFGAPDTRPAATKESVIVADAPVKVRSAEYVPTWKNDKSGVQTDSVEFDSVAISSFLFPSDDVEPVFIRYKIDYPYLLATHSSLHELIESIAGKNKTYIADVSHKSANVVPGKHDDIKTVLAELNAIVISKGAPSSKLKSVNKYLNTLPQGIYSAFASTIVNRFNQCLAARLLQVKDNFNMSIRINTVDDMLGFIPGNSSTKLAKLISTTNYIDALNNVLIYVLKYFETATISTSKEDILQALKTVGSVDSLKDVVSILNDENNIKSVLNNNTVVVNDARTVVTNMPFNKSNIISEVVATKLADCRSVPTCALDLILPTMADTSDPIKIISSDNVVLYCGWTMDQLLTYAV